MDILNSAYSDFFKTLYREDDLDRNLVYMKDLPTDPVLCRLKIKSDLVLSGGEFFALAFMHLGGNHIDHEILKNDEGLWIQETDKKEYTFSLPFNIALTGERLALNLLQRSCAISTSTKRLVNKAEPKGIKILDTRKTTPGLRALEKNAVVCGGGYNHRLGQADMWMVKDNHKKFFGGVTKAVEFFRSKRGFYTPIEVEIHDLDELKEAFDLGINHVMLDNFSPDEIEKAVAIKPLDCTYEVSGGVNLSNIETYLIEGVDAISAGFITSYPERVDISLKLEPLS
ncbi:MAG: carboxylating nicotinate-nucleotide diphosphorylase [Bacteriovoracaceae bacterium]|nr:carboxylating nicotinate-nucleotide diphosphorylase [Bacteriovoracaceae bacterium]